MHNQTFQIQFGAGFGFYERQRFISEATGDIVSSHRELDLDIQIDDFVRLIVELGDTLTGAPARILSHSAHTMAVQFIGTGQCGLVQLEIWPGRAARDYYYPEGPQLSVPPAGTRIRYSVAVTGSPPFVTEFVGGLYRLFGSDTRAATVNWYFHTEQGTECRIVPMEPPPPMHDEFYPWIEGGVDAYIGRYLSSPASVLFLMGPPGTGKTSLLRHMIYSHRLKAFVTYEEALISADRMFIDFLSDPDDALLLIEDSELIVGSRDSEGNKLMARFLNVSDGLVKTSGKKLVFTTNQGDFARVDEALIRAGRCFDAMRLRPLTAEEAERAAAVAGLPKPGGGEQTLGDLFNRQAPAVRAIGRRTGF
jgi:hypothetical protein